MDYPAVKSIPYKIKSPEMSFLIEGYCTSMPFQRHLKRILEEVLPDFDVHLFGGVMRSALIYLQTGRRFPARDLDLLVMTEGKQDEFYGRVKTLSKISKSTLGCPKWNPDGNFEIDLIASTDNTFRNLDTSEKRPEGDEVVFAYLKTCNFNVNAASYDFRRKEVYNYGAVEGIKAKTVEIQDYQAMHPGTTLTNLVMTSEKLRFRLGENAVRFIAEEYSPDIDRFIRQYMAYKKYTKKQFAATIEKLRAIQKQANTIP